MDLAWLAGAEGQAAIEALRGVDPLRARALHPELSIERLTDALGQAAHKPVDFPLPLVTPDGIQQSTPVAVALRRAQRLALTQDTVIDTGCGVGVDAWAFQQAGLTVVAFEQDPLTAAIARANGIDVTCADATGVELPPGCVYTDPARRKAHRSTHGQAIRTHDPQHWQPPWDWVLAHAQVARVAPGLREIPENAEWHCSSIRRSLVDATVWFAPLDQVDRRASVLHHGVWHELTGPAAPAQTGDVGEYIVDPDPAIVRAGLVSNLGGRLLDPKLAFVTFDEQPEAWVGRAMRVLEEVPLKAVAAACRRLGMQRVTVWARGFDPVPRLGLREGQDGIVVMARLGSRRVARAWIGTPVSPAGGAFSPGL